MKHNPATLANLATSPDPIARLRALRLMRCQIEAGQPPHDYFELARGMLRDSDHDCRWQAAIVVSRSIASHPDDVWQVVREYGESPDEDMRDAIATILLDELLQHSPYFTRVSESIAGGAKLLADTLRRCGVDDSTQDR